MSESRAVRHNGRTVPVSIRPLSAEEKRERSTTAALKQLAEVAIPLSDFWRVSLFVSSHLGMFVLGYLYAERPVISLDDPGGSTEKAIRRFCNDVESYAAALVLPQKPTGPITVEIVEYPS